MIFSKRLFAAASLYLLSLTTTSLAFQYNISAEIRSGQCLLSINDKPYQVLPKNVVLTWIHEGGQQTTVYGSVCRVLTKKTPVLTNLGQRTALPGLQRRQTDALYGVTANSIRVWIGPSVITNRSFLEASATVATPPTPNVVEIQQGSNGVWIGLQPAGFTPGKQSFVFQPVIGWNQLLDFDKNYTFNMYCAQNGCPFGPVVPAKPGDKIDMLIKYFPKNKRFPALWQSALRNRRTGIVQKFVIPNDTMIATLDSPFFCQGGFCKLPSFEIVSQEYYVSDQLPLNQLITMFFPTKKIQFDNVKFKTYKDDDILWMKADQALLFEYGDIAAQGVDGLRQQVAKMRKKYMYTNCMYHLLKQIKYSRKKVGDHYVVTSTSPQINPKECTEAFYNK